MNKSKKTQTMMSHPSPIPEYHYDDTQTFDIQSTDPSFQTNIQSWEQLMGESSHHQQSESSTSNDQTGTFPFQPMTEELDPQIDYETIIRSKNLFYDPSPEVIRKSSTDNNSMVYTQNIMIRFLQPPPIQQGPLIIREIRPPQPPPPPPLVVRQRPPPPLSPPPIILREKPPPIPPILTAQTITRTLPPLPPPPRTVIIEKLPALPAKPRDIIIERWLPYESTKQKRQVFVQRAEEPKAYPKPRNVIITYEPIQALIVRQVERLGVKMEDPKAYEAMYQTSLLDTRQLLHEIQQLGINEEFNPPSTNYDNLAQYSQTPIPQDFSTISDDDLSAQLAQYGVTADSIPH